MGTYWAYFLQKKSDNKLYSTKYGVITVKDNFGKLVLYFVHPEAMMKAIKGKKYGDGDHVWYQCDMPETQSPSTLPLMRRLSSTIWPQQINLTIVEDEKIISQYKKWQTSCDVINNYDQYEYELTQD